MPFPRLQLEGYSLDRTHIRCAVEIDTDTFHFEGLGHGRRLVWQANSTMALSWDNGGGSPFSNGVTQLLEVGGWLSVEAQNQRVWTCPIPPTILTYYHGNSILFAVPLDDYDLESIEGVRHANGIEFGLELSGLVKLATSDSISVTKHNYPGASHTLWPVEVVALGSTNGALRFTIGREQWLQLLNSTGVRRDLIELPTPTTPQGDSWADILRLAREAEDRFRLGYYEDVLKRTREIAEGIQALLSNQWSFSKSDVSYTKWAEALGNWLEGQWGGRDGRARTLTSLLAAVWTWSSPSHHFSSRVPRKEEASFAIRMAASLISFTAQLLDAYPVLDGSEV